MAINRGREYVGVTEVLDGNEYRHCTFRDCTLIYQGGELPKLQNNLMDNCHFKLEEAAERTVAFLNGIARDMGAQGKRFLEQAFQVE